MTAKADSLPPIPDKRYFSIGEVGDLCRVKSHVLRYWEQEFAQLQPVKRRGNRRYYRKQDIEIARGIRSLLYEQGFTIQGARLQLENKTPAAAPVIRPNSYAVDSMTAIREELESIVQSLEK